MKRLSFVALALASLAASVPAQAFDVPPAAKATWKAGVVKGTKDMTLNEFCWMKGVAAFDAEGTAPDSIERGMDYGMVEAYYVHARGWTDDQKSECARLEIQGYSASAQEAEDEGAAE
ncbi:MAG: hypothetical protein ACRC8D_08360 [Aeromonas sp.]